MAEVKRRKRRTTEEAAPPRRKRKAVAEAVESETRANAYFVATDKGVEGFSTGCLLFDQALGGIGWARRRIINIIGDKSTGKTLLAIEGMINFYREVPNCRRILYKECESAFDNDYAAALGLPLDAVDKKKRPIIDVSDDLSTVEDVYDSIEKLIAEAEADPEGEYLYIVDSLDGLSDRAEQKRGIADASYGQDKAKKLSEFFRKKHNAMSKAGITLLIISQIRDNIGAAMFGKKSKRSGGKALDFYCSQVVWLSNMGKVKRTVRGKARIIGVDIRAGVEKNKVGNPYRTCDYPIIFGYGVDDIWAMVKWLSDEVGWEVLEPLGFKKSNHVLTITKIRNEGGERAREVRKQLSDLVIEYWQDLELNLMPQTGKY